ncbi:growth arrest-specific protein 7a isoform X1 [Brachyhypopomus gauderio]|uniref:growth arrest-specific protein 7a isoform X1 n=1 Tax=Brachyhypopomus gauderio TaxID=698409 RepID=UPI004041FBFC
MHTGLSRPLLSCKGSFEELEYMECRGSSCGADQKGASAPLPAGWRCSRPDEGHKDHADDTETGWEQTRALVSTSKAERTRKSSVNGCRPRGAHIQHPKKADVALQRSGPIHQSPGSLSPARRQNKEKEIKETKTTINFVTFPLSQSTPEQQLLKPSEWSYCDYFWADKKDPQGATTVSGFEVLLQKQLKGKQMQKEMAEFIRERIKIEEEYAKNLSKLSQIPLAAQEEGTLGEAWAQLKKSLADEADVHLKFSSKLHSEVEKPLLVFRGDNFKKDMKKYDHHIADLRKQLVSRYAAVEKARKALADRQKDLEVKTQQLEIKLSNKTEEDIKKARRKSTQAGDDLMRCVDLYNQAQSKWFEEMVTTSLELERLEVERVEMIQQHLCQYTTLRRETDMFNQSTLEPVDQLLQSVDPAKDRELWVREHKTGDLRPVDMDI